MNRRTFLKTSAAGATLAGAVSLTSPASAQAGGQQRLLEWRRYAIGSGQKRNFITAFLRDAALPALNRLGIRPVGVFHELPDANDFSVYVLIPFGRPELLGRVRDTLGEDATFMEAAEEYLNTPKGDPAYQRIESSLLKTFAGYPEVRIPRTGDRIFELRTYESHNELKAARKIEMFNEAELEIFRKVNLDGVFYGQMLIGPNLPNLTYMLAYQDRAERESNWKAFQEHPDWLVLKEQERYRDTVSRIIAKFLIPAPGSQI